MPRIRSRPLAVSRPWSWPWGVMGIGMGYAIAAAVETGKRVLCIEGDSAFGDQNPRKGQQVSLESFAKLREGKDPITKLKFSPLPEAQAAVA